MAHNSHVLPFAGKESNFQKPTKRAIMEKSMENYCCIDYSAALSDLKIKKMQLDELISTIEHLINNGVLSCDASPNISAGNTTSVEEVNLAHLSVYHATVVLLKNNKGKMKPSKIADAIIASGKEFTSKDPKNSIVSSLYSTMKERANCEFKKLGNGEIGLIQVSSVL